MENIDLNFDLEYPRPEHTGNVFPRKKKKKDDEVINNGHNTYCSGISKIYMR